MENHLKIMFQIRGASFVLLNVIGLLGGQTQNIKGIGLAKKGWVWLAKITLNGKVMRLVTLHYMLGCIDNLGLRQSVIFAYLQIESGIIGQTLAVFIKEMLRIGKDFVFRATVSLTKQEYDCRLHDLQRGA